MASFTSLYDALSDLEPSAYSGRGMYGNQCIAVSLPNEQALWDLAVALTSAEVFPGAPTTDSFGKGIIAYWPDIAWDEEALKEGDPDGCPGEDQSEGDFDCERNA